MVELMEGSVYFGDLDGELTQSEIGSALDNFFASTDLSGLAPTEVYDLDILLFRGESLEHLLALRILSTRRGHLVEMISVVLRLARLEQPLSDTTSRLFHSNHSLSPRQHRPYLFHRPCTLQYSRAVTWLASTMNVASG